MTHFYGHIPADFDPLFAASALLMVAFIAALHEKLERLGPGASGKLRAPLFAAGVALAIADIAVVSFFPPRLFSNATIPWVLLAGWLCGLPAARRGIPRCG